MLPQSPSESKWLQPPNAGSPAVRRAGTRGQHYLCLLACLWLLGGLDLGLSALAQAHGFLDGGSECNPLAALVLPFGPWALAAYKILLTAGGTAGLLLCRRCRMARWTALGALIVYALVTMNWMLVYSIFAPLRASSLRLGAFCTKADCIAVLTLTCLVVLCGLASGLLRNSPGRDCCALRSNKSSRSEQGAVTDGHRPPAMSLCGLAAIVTWICLFPPSCSPTHSAQEKRETWPKGTIYFREWLDTGGTWPDDEGPLWRMNADGTARTKLPRGVGGEPSGYTHGGYRWFLDIRDVPGASYPDGRQRRELFAIRSDGYRVQLTDQPELEPSPSVPRWLAHAEDQAASWVARRWDHTGRVVEGGIYVADLVHGERGGIQGLAGPPILFLPLPLVALPLENDPWWRSRAPDIRSHDWSPDGTAIVYDSMTSNLCIASPWTGVSTRITTVPACSPDWSPDGARIAFKIHKPFGGIATIRPDGGEMRIVISTTSDKRSVITAPRWSPSGRYLLYQRVSVPQLAELPADVDVFVAAADGDGAVNLTPDVDAFLVPVAWR